MHILPEEAELGKGNYAFSSFDCLVGKTTSRRDDLISLLYIMLHLHCGDFSYLGTNSETITEEEILQAKQHPTADSMCTGNLDVFKQFA